MIPAKEFVSVGADEAARRASAEDVLAAEVVKTAQKLGLTTVYLEPSRAKVYAAKFLKAGYYVRQRGPRLDFRPTLSWFQSRFQNWRFNAS